MTTQTLPGPSTTAALLTDTRILYCMYYRKGDNPHPQFILFYHKSKEMKLVMERARRHCEVMGYKFTSVRPAIVNMEEVENYMNRDNV